MMETAVVVVVTAAGVAFINKIGNAIGWWAEPRQIIRKAEAEAKAAMIQAKSDIEVADFKRRVESDIEIPDLNRRTEARVAFESIKQQANMEGIACAALSYLNISDATPQDVEDDWVTNFFEKCHNVSDEEMQQAWARILAGEANNPGSFSRKTVNVMADLGKADAEMFRNLCRFVCTQWSGRIDIPLVFDFYHEIYNQQGVQFESCAHLEDLGLVKMEGLTSLSLIAKPLFIVSYDEKTVIVESTKEDNRVNVGHIMFTKVGAELSRICQAEPVDGFFEYVCDVWTRKGLTVTPAVMNTR